MKQTLSQQKQAKLHQLLQDNNLQLSIADLIEFTYHKISEEYLSLSVLAEHIEADRKHMVMNSCTEGDLQHICKLGKALYIAHYNENKRA